MKEFKFFQKEIINYNVYEEMVLGMLDYCRNNAINPVGMSHPFVITEITGVQHKRIVIRNVTRYGSPNITFIKIEYDIHLTNNHPNDSVTSHTLEINEEEYIRLTEQYERF
jgi:hypothetical protein